MNLEGIAGTEGVNLRLRLIRPDDAPYLYALRSDPRYTLHLSPIVGEVAEQRSWIERYKVREAKRVEYYYVIERRDDGTACGLVRLYEIMGGEFAWGSWILDQNKPAKAALESAVLSFKLGFLSLGARLAHVEVRKSNAHALAFYRRFGMTEVGSDVENIFLEYPREHFERDLEEFCKLLKERQSE